MAYDSKQIDGYISRLHKLVILVINECHNDFNVASSNAIPD